MILTEKNPSVVVSLLWFVNSLHCRGSVITRNMGLSSQFYNWIGILHYIVKKLAN